MNRAVLIGSLGALLLLNSGARGQAALTLPPAKIGKLANLVPVIAPEARCLAISETSSWLAFGHETTYAKAHVSLVRLDAKGNPASFSIPLQLPRPAGLVKHPNYPISLAFHPKLPLLYVWQDLTIALTNPPPAAPPDLNVFDHLLIYNVAKETPELLASLCRGVEYICGSAGGSIFVDPSAGHLYVPNLRDPKNTGILRCGRFILDDAGLPRVDDKLAALPPPQRAKRLTEMNAARPIVPHDLTYPEYVNMFPFNPYGCGFSFLPIGKEGVIAGTWNGLVAWKPGDKAITLSGLSFRQSAYKFLAAHPTLPVLYAPLFGTDMIYRAEHVDGYLTQVPQFWKIPEARLISPPAVLDKGKRLAVGDQNRIFVMALDDQGRPCPELIQVAVLNPQVKAMAYSERFDRLYVSMEVPR